MGPGTTSAVSGADNDDDDDNENNENSEEHVAEIPSSSVTDVGSTSDTAAVSPEDLIFEGQAFTTFEALEEAVRHFELATLHKYFKSEARTVESAAKKGIKRAEDNRRFRYYSCLWLCVRGGKSFCRSRGERKSRTIRIGCPALIRTRISDCGRLFRVVQVVYEHNHGSSPEMFRQLQTTQAGVKHEDPQKKSKYIKKMSVLQSNAQAQLRELLGSVTGEGNALSIEESVDKLSQVYADDLTVAVDETNECVALTLCTEAMRTLWSEFPELLIVESSSYIESLDLANVVHFLVVDALGELRPVMFAILLKADENLYEWLLHEFIRQHPSAATSTQILLVGRPYTELQFVGEVFSTAQVFWEPSQSINSFRIEVASKAVHLTETGRRVAAEHFKKLVFCRSPEMKRVLREDFAAALSAVPEAVQACYDQDWEPHYSLWNMSLHPYDETQQEYVLKRMQKFKRYCRTILQNAAPNLYAVFTKIVNLFSLLDDLYNGDVLYHLIKVNQSRYQPKTPVDEAEFKYKALVTEFAYMFLKSQFSTFERGLKLLENNRMATFTRVGDREVKICTSKNSCSCIAFTALRLPCVHLLSFRIGSQLDLYNEELVADRWKRSNIRVEGDADKLVRLPLTAAVGEPAETHNGGEINESVQDLEVQIIQEEQIEQHPDVVADDTAQISVEIPSVVEASSCEEQNTAVPTAAPNSSGQKQSSLVGIESPADELGKRDLVHQQQPQQQQHHHQRSGQTSASRGEDEGEVDGNFAEAPVPVVTGGSSSVSTTAAAAASTTLSSASGPLPSGGRGKRMPSSNVKASLAEKRPRPNESTATTTVTETVTMTAGTLAGTATTTTSRATRQQYRERRQQIEELCAELCAVGSGVWGPLFSLRMGVLRDILNAWQDGEEVTVQRVPHEAVTADHERVQLLQLQPHQQPPQPQRPIQEQRYQQQQPQQTYQLLASHPQTQQPQQMSRDTAGQFFTIVDTGAAPSGGPVVSFTAAEPQLTAGASAAAAGVATTANGPLEGTTLLRCTQPAVVQLKGRQQQQVYFLNSDENGVQQLVDNYRGQLFTIETTADEPVDGDGDADDDEDDDRARNDVLVQ